MADAQSGRLSSGCLLKGDGGTKASDARGERKAQGRNRRRRTVEDGEEGPRAVPTSLYGRVSSRERYRTSRTVPEISAGAAIL